MKDVKRIYSPIRYAGGKTKAAKYISERIPTDVERLVSPFIGGASLEIYIAKTREDVEVIGYDIFQPLVEFWNIILSSPKELADAVAEYRPTKKCFTETREQLKEWWGKHEDIVKRGDKIEFADSNSLLKFVAMYYYNHQYSYGPMFLGWPSSVYLNAKVHKQIVKRLAEFKCPNLKVRWGDFKKSIPKHEGDFLYVDPPYYDVDEAGNNLFKPLYPNCNFPIHHRGFDHSYLCHLLLNHKGGFILSYNDCPTIREWYKDPSYKLEYPSWHYSYAQGEKRIGENREEKMKVDAEGMSADQKKEAQKKKSHEILVINTTPPPPPINATTTGILSGTELF
jgi:DNA adenine methylase